MIGDIAVALGVVFVAELGDKSQLLTLTFATRYHWAVVLAGVTLATAALMAVSVLVGGIAGDVIPRRGIEVFAGLVFLGFAVWTLRGDGDDEEDDDEAAPSAGTTGGLLTVAGTFALAELGDKTMLTALTLASTQEWFATWLGATLGMVGANVLALVVGDQIGTRLSPRVLRWCAAALFALFGVLLLIGVG